MPIEECPHCVNKVMFSDDGYCPACNMSKYIIPSKNRNQIIYEKDKTDALDRINYYSNRGPRLIIGGIVLSIITFIGFFIMLLYGALIFYWLGGFIVGFSLIGKGIKDLRDKKEIAYFFEKKYKEKLLNKEQLKYA